MKRLILLTFSALFCFGNQSISNKRESMHQEAARMGPQTDFSTLNLELGALRDELKNLYTHVQDLYEHEADPAAFKDLLSQINTLKSELNEKESSWHRASQKDAQRGDEGYGFWDQEETTLSQLVMEYGSSDHLYIIPPEMMSMKLNLRSNIAIPRESWSELIKIVLSQNGIGVKEINPYTRQLFILRQNLMAVSMVVSDNAALELTPDFERVVYLFSPSPENVKGVAHFFERFRDPKRTFIYQVSQKVAIVGTKEDVKRLLTLYDAVWDQTNQKETRVLTLNKTSPFEMEKILKAFFGDSSDRGRLSLAKGSGEGLTLIPLSHENAIVMIGMHQTLNRAEEVVRKTEDQIDDPSEMTVYWYSCRHSDPVGLSDVLERVYISLVGHALEGSNIPPPPAPPKEEKKPGEVCNVPQYPDMPASLPTYGPPVCPPTIQPSPVQAGTVNDQMQSSTTQNFIPYDKTGAIMMVVRKDTLPKLKELLKKLDVPKKMVQLEVLLFEKTVKEQDNIGLNILKVGSCASQTHKTAACFDTTKSAAIPGLLEFILFRKKTSSMPAYDLAYSFLMTQEDIRVNAAPSVTTVNQTPASIKVVDEISINNGAAPLETQTGITFENSFSRAQYGISIVVTPTVHEPELDDTESDWYITIETDVNFDNIISDENDRPNVARRQIKNLVRVANGETIILGGLRRKIGEERNEKIPFLGEIPGIAKLFSSTRMTDQTTEMFMFITPTIIDDPKDDVIRSRIAQLCKRAGDVPEYLQRLCDAQRAAKRRKLARSFNLIFGDGLDRDFCPR